MTPEIRVADDGTYELGAEVNGVWVPFVSHPGTWVEGIVQSGKTAEQGTPAEPTQESSQHA